MTKRILATLLSVLMMLSLATGCQGGGTTSSGTASSGGSSSQPTSSQEESKGVDLSIKRDISICMPNNTFVTDWEDNDLTKHLEEEFNCDITMYVLPAGNDALSKLQLMINGGDDLTDVITYGLSSALRYQYGNSGTLIALNDYFDNKEIMPNFNAIESEEDKTAMKANMMSADGNIYSLSQWQPEPWNLSPYRLYMNMKWLDNLGLEVPTTTDELKEVLTKFATEDPNGNGIRDEIPVLAAYNDGGSYGCNTVLGIINFFTFTGPSMSSLALSEDGKNVVAPQITDEWREAMKYLRELSQAGAILADGSLIPGTDTSSFKGSLNFQGNGIEAAPDGKSVNIVGMFTAGSNSGNFANSGIDENVNYLEYQMIPVPKNPNGTAYSPYAPNAGAALWQVTEQCDDIDFAVHMGDWFYETKASMWARYGLEGVDWTMDEKYCADWYTQHTALIESTGNKQTIKDYYSLVRLRADAAWGENTSVFWKNNQPRYASEEFFSHVVDYFDPETFVYYNGNYGRLSSISREYYGSLHPEYVIPGLAYTDDEQKKIQEFQVAFPDEILTWTMKFITGEKDPTKDSDWEEYKSVLDSLGLGVYLETAQAAYERTLYYETYIK